MKGEDIFRGILLVISLWVINTAIAFLVFNRGTPTEYVIITWIFLDIIIITFHAVFKFFSRGMILTIFIIALLLAGLYLIPINNNIPESAIKLNNQISDRNIDRINYAEELFWEVEGKWNISVRTYLLEPHKIFLKKDFEYYWNLKQGSYIDCYANAQIYKKLLLASGRFVEGEVKIKQSLCVNSPHAIVLVEEKFYADFWAVDKFPEYKFGQYSPAPCDRLPELN